MLNGFLNLDKPKGITAHDCVSRVRRSLQQKRVGHSGTLDPAAIGVLPIALGQATRLLQFLPTGKAYIATVRFGIVTATDDLEGEVISAKPCSSLQLSDVVNLLPKFQGTISQRPPAFSAIQVNGVRLYELARAGQIVEAPIRTVEIKQTKVLAWREGDFPELDLEIVCGGGTYIRAIARDLGEMLGCGATLSSLQRTVSNNFDISGSVSLEAVAGRKFELVTPAIALSHLPSINLDAESVNRWQQGQAISLVTALDELSHILVYSSDLVFQGVGQIQSERLRPVVVFK